MLVVALILLIINIILMFFFFLKIRHDTSHERQQVLMKERMNSILKEFNFQTDQAVTILEEKIKETRKLIVDADKRFLALSKQLEASYLQDKRIKQYEIANSIERIELKNEVDVNKNNLKEDDSKESINTFVYKGSAEMAQSDKILKMKVVEMYKNGWSIDFIADKLSLSREEVRLIAFMAD